MDAAAPPVLPARLPVLAAGIDAVSLEAATGRVLAWARAGESRAVCAANVHVVMEAADHPDFAACLAAADLVTPDGMPLVWVLRAAGMKAQSRASGPDLTLALLARAEAEGIPVGFHGSTPGTLAALRAALAARHPVLKLVYCESPPFRPLSPGERAAEVAAIRASGARLLFVGLGCPKQERWVAGRRGEIPAVMLAVGAAFDFLAGTRRRAPAWMRAAGLEWLHRLLAEPGRLWRRYLVLNSRFLLRLPGAIRAARRAAGGR